MITKNWNLTVDFDRGVTYRPMRFVAGDSGSCEITFTTVQDIDGLRVFVTFVMSDGTSYIHEATVTGTNTAELVLPSGVLSVAGQVTCQVAVHDATGRLTNAVGFYYTVSEDLAEGAIEASDQYPILTQLIAECEGIEDAEALRVIAEGAADPRSGRVGAELDREDAEAIRIANEGDETSGRVKAELDRAAAELLRVAAEGAASPKSGRVGAELDRAAAELARVAAEGDATKGRVKAENDRVAAEEAREIAEGLRQAHITDKENPHEVTAAQAGAVATTDIADNLTTDDATKVLSAKQGKVLADLVSTNFSYSKGEIISDVTLTSAWKAGTATIDTGTGVITLPGHGFKNNTPVEFSDGTGSLPTGIEAYDKEPYWGEYYNVINVSGDTFQITATVGGTSPVIPSDAGTAGWQVRSAGYGNFSASIGGIMDNGKSFEIIAIVPFVKVTNQSMGLTGHYARLQTSGTGDLYTSVPYETIYNPASSIELIGNSNAHKYNQAVDTIRLTKLNDIVSFNATSIINSANTRVLDAKGRMKIDYANSMAYGGLQISGLTHGIYISSAWTTSYILRNGTRIIVRRVNV